MHVYRDVLSEVGDIHNEVLSGSLNALPEMKHVFYEITECPS
jgi:hypothetical protein